MWKKYDTEGMRAQLRGDFSNAKKQYTAAIEEAEKIGPQDPLLAGSLSRLSRLYTRNGWINEAEPILKRLLEIREKRLGPEHVDVAFSLNRLADVYHRQGRFKEAEPLFKRALAISKKKLAPGHPLVKTIHKNLTLLHQGQGEYAGVLKAAEKGNAKAQHRFAMMYLEGRVVPRDYVQAYKWLNLSGLFLPPGQTRDRSVRAIDQLEKQMTPAQITRAQRLVSEWWAKHKKK
jgi:TPR repeat protein